MRPLIYIFLLRIVVLLPYEKCSDFIIKEKWDYRETNFDNATIQLTDADCCAQCSDDDDCNAFTWIPDSGECWLHHNISGGDFNLSTHAGHRRGKRYS